MKVTVSELRANIFRLLDQVLKTGIPLEVERKGKRLRILSPDGCSKLERLERRENFIVGDPDELIHLDWSEEWRP